MLGAKIILRAARLELAVGIDEEDFPGALRRFFLLRSRDDDAGRDAGVVEELRRQADDGLDMSLSMNFFRILPSSPLRNKTP